METQTCYNKLYEKKTELSKNIHSEKSKNNLFKSIEYIHENFRENISIGYLASMENLSPSRYRAVFNRLMGESPLEYITKMRIDVAAEMLENSNKSLSEIASLVGYNDVYYFSRRFKKYIGTAPGRYRKSKQNQ